MALRTKLEVIMKVKFKGPVDFSTRTRAFTGEGIPPIPEGARQIRVNDHTTAYVARSGEAWECFIGNGTTETSKTLYWPSLCMCPRPWAKAAK